MSLLILGVVEQVLRLVNNLIEDQPAEIRRANAIIWFNATLPLIKPFLSKEVQTQVDNIALEINKPEGS